jgi:uncharacterized membrane protein
MAASRALTDGRVVKVKLEAPGPVAMVQITAMVVALAAAALAIFAVFQTAFQSGLEYPVISPGNTLIQKESGWPILGCAVGIVASVVLYRLGGRRAVLWAMLAACLGALIYAATIYQETGGREVVEAGGGPLLIALDGVHGSPGTGLRLAKAAGLLAMISGLVLASCLSYLPSREVSVQDPGVRGGATA